METTFNATSKSTVWWNSILLTPGVERVKSCAKRPSCGTGLKSLWSEAQSFKTGQLHAPIPPKMISFNLITNVERLLSEVSFFSFVN